MDRYQLWMAQYLLAARKVQQVVESTLNPVGMAHVANG